MTGVQTCALPISEQKKSPIAVITEINKAEQKNKSNEDDRTSEIKSVVVVDKDGNSVSANESINPTGAAIITAFTSDELRKIKYSIQVGMYVRLINA